MRWLRKKIIDWLFGSKFTDFEKMFDSYLNIFDSYENLYKDYTNATDKLITTFEEQRNLIAISKDACEQNEHLVRMCKAFLIAVKENNVDIEKIKLDEDDDDEEDSNKNNEE